MVIKSGSFCYLLATIITVGNLIVMSTDAYAQKPEESLEWSIKTSKGAFYAGEPVLLTLNINNNGRQKEKIDFGADGIEAFSMEIHDISNKVVAKRGKIKRFGFSSRGPLELPPNKIGQKSIVLNQWCSTLLPPGKYHVVCYVEYRLRSEATKIPGTEPSFFSAGPLHSIELKLDIEIIKSNNSEFKKILEDLDSRESRKPEQTKNEWLRDRKIAREMIAFAESDLAVPYQLELLRVEPSTNLKWDVINSLARSGTLEAAKGLIQIVRENEDRLELIEDIKREIIEAVYRLRETGKADIINATDEFVVKYKRPVLANPTD